MSELASVQAMVYGFVQGVFFRDFVDSLDLDDLGDN